MVMSELPSSNGLPASRRSRNVDAMEQLDSELRRFVMRKARAGVNITWPEAFTRHRSFNTALALEGDKFSTWDLQVRTQRLGECQQSVAGGEADSSLAGRTWAQRKHSPALREGIH